jgi:hypothetical protein
VTDEWIARQWSESRVASVPRAITIATAVGLVAALTGFIDGIVLMAKKTVKDCPDGTFFPVGTKDFTCYAHPRAGEGLAYSAISLSVAVLILLVAYVAAAMSRRSEAH